jgi:hypothetical protein
MALPKTFSAGERLFAADLNDNFEEIDGRSALVVYSGSTSSSVSANSASETSVTFPSGLFASAPNVIVSLSELSINSANCDNIRVFANSITSSGFTLRAINTESASTTFGRTWVAIGVAGGSLPKTFVSGERLFASDLNDNFEHLDDKTSFDATLASGTFTLSVGTGGSVDTSVTFPTGRFSSAPNVIVGWSRSSTTQNNARFVNAFANSITSTGFTFRMTNASQTATNISAFWLAVQN